MTEVPTPTPEMIERKPTAEQIARSFSALGDSVSLVQKIIKAEGTPSENDVFAVSRNVNHLVIMKDKTTWWTTEDFTAVNKAIADGNAFLAANNQPTF